MWLVIEESFTQPSSPSAVHVRFVYVGRGKCFQIPQLGIAYHRRWKQCQNLKRNASTFSSALGCHVSSPFGHPSPAFLRFVMLIVSNSRHHSCVYFPFSSPFSPPQLHTAAAFDHQFVQTSLSAWLLVPQMPRPFN